MVENTEEIDMQKKSCFSSVGRTADSYPADPESDSGGSKRTECGSMEGHQFWELEHGNVDAGSSPVAPT